MEPTLRPKWEPDPRRISALLRKCRAGRSIEEAWQVAHKAGYGPERLAKLIPERGPRRTGVTQYQMARLLDHHPGTYIRWERGESPIPADMLPRIAAILGMDRRTRVYFWRLAAGQDPPRGTAGPDIGLVPDTWIRYVHRQPHPAHICTFTWDWVVYNDALRDYFPYAFADGQPPETNVMRLLFRPESRQVMENWETDWALPAWQDIWYAYTRYPDNDTLRGLVNQVKRDPDLRKALWKRRDDDPSDTPDTTRRRLHHPRLGLITLDLLVADPQALRDEGYRFMTFNVLDDTPDA